MEQTLERMKQNITHTITTDHHNCAMCQDEGWIGYTGEDGYFYARECACGIINRKKESSRVAFANIPDRYKGLNMSAFDVKWYGNDQPIAENAKKIAMHYIGNYFNLQPGRGLYLFSKTKGTGKTRLAAIIANELMKIGVEVKFATSGEILEEIKRTWNKETEYSESTLINSLTKTDVLIIDDFGVEKAKEWRNEKFYNIINSRYVSLRPTIFTSNYNLSDLENEGYDSRIISRINESCYMLPFPGESVRDAQAKENQMEMKTWLRNS